MHARLYFVACASAALLGAAACNNNSAKTTTDETKPAPDTTAAAKAPAEDQQRPISLNGCLQKGDGSNYILTQINEPPKGEPVAQQDLKEAEHAYRLNAKNTSDDDWDKMVGHQVRVSGTLAKAADIDQQVGTSGSSDAKDRPKIHEGDLAQVDVADIQMTAASCGGHAAKPAAKASAKSRRR
jgi:hypothetical protein